MAEFNAMDTAAFKGVWVFCEQREGELQSISSQLLSEGRALLRAAAWPSLTPRRWAATALTAFTTSIAPC